MSIGDIVPNYYGGAAPVYGCHRNMVLTILLAAQHKRAHPTLTPAGEGWYSIYLYTGGIEG